MVSLLGREQLLQRRQRLQRIVLCRDSLALTGLAPAPPFRVGYLACGQAF